MNLPKREELSLRSVLALPKASRMGFAASTFLSAPLALPAQSARYSRHTLHVTVLPAPDSPEMSTDWFAPFSTTFWYAAPMTRYGCGASSASVPAARAYSRRSAGVK